MFHSFLREKKREKNTCIHIEREKKEREKEIERNRKRGREKYVGGGGVPECRNPLLIMTVAYFMMGQAKQPQP